jgi:hypothetical protein
MWGAWGCLAAGRPWEARVPRCQRPSPRVPAGRFPLSRSRPRHRRAMLPYPPYKSQHLQATRSDNRLRTEDKIQAAQQRIFGIESCSVIELTNLINHTGLQRTNSSKFQHYFRRSWAQMYIHEIINQINYIWTRFEQQLALVYTEWIPNTNKGVIGCPAW